MDLGSHLPRVDPRLCRARIYAASIDPTYEHLARIARRMRDVERHRYRDPLNNLLHRLLL